MANDLLPLENRLRNLATTSAARFPNRNDNYWARYEALVSFLRTRYYPFINAGLACLSKSPGIYTDHGGDHFDEVVHYAGLLAEPAFDGGGEIIEPYDLFLLLMGIRLHDAGNLDGREQHERRVYAILKEAGSAVCGDDVEADLIARIAEAHGGKLDNDDKDTIGALPEQSAFGSVRCKPQFVAALVRFSDEICEHSNRASSQHIKNGTLPLQNTLFHLYAHSVKSAVPDRNQKAFNIRLVFDAVHLREQFPTPSNGSGSTIKRFLLDDALERLQKLDTERRYCNRFLDPILRTERIDVAIEIVKTESANGLSLRKNWRNWSFQIRDRGYPNDNNSWRKDHDEISGGNIAAMLNDEGGSGEPE